MDKVPVRHGFSASTCGASVSIITPMFFTDNLFIYHRRYVILPFCSVVQWKRSRSAVETLLAEELTF